MSELYGNEYQRSAISHFRGPAQIIAGPGSGKTFTIVNRIQYLISHHKVSPDHILVITFTRKAALEMQQRFYKAFSSVTVQRPPVYFGTFHSLFYHILNTSAEYQNYSVISEAEKKKHIRSIWNIHNIRTPIREEDYPLLMQIINSIRYESIASCDYAKVAEFLVRYDSLTEDKLYAIAADYHTYLKDFNKMDFDGLQYLCYELLKNNTAVLEHFREQFSYILIDEFQDISPIQYQIIQLLAHTHNNLFVVGDDDQSIYGFRGAKPDIMQQFQEDYPNCVRIHLKINYRCHEAIVSFSQEMVSHNTVRIPKAILANHTSGEGVNVSFYPSVQEEEAALIERIKKQQAANKLNNCAIICRTNFECSMWMHALNYHQIPYVYDEQGHNLFNHSIVKDLIAYLELSQGSRRRYDFLRIMNKPIRYLKRESLPDEIVSVKDWLKYYQSYPQLQKTLLTFLNGLERIKNMKPALAIRYIKQVIGYDNYIREELTYEKQTEAMDIIKAIEKVAQRYQSIEELLLAIKESEGIRSNDQKAKKSTGKIQKNSENGIHLLTIHAAKGLEFESVFLPGCQDGKMPSKKSTTKEEIEEERRMFYVAVTRAQNNLYISCIDGKGKSDSPSRFLTEMQAHCNQYEHKYS